MIHITFIHLHLVRLKDYTISQPLNQKTKQYLSTIDNKKILSELSGSIIRKLLLKNQELPAYLVRKKVSGILKK